MKKRSILTRITAIALAVTLVGTLSCLCARPAYAIQRVLEVYVKIEPPRAGHVPDTTGSMSTVPPRGVSMSRLSWNPGDAKFGLGKQYTATFTLKTDSDYMFVENVTVKVNGKNAKWQNCAPHTIKVSYTFDKVPGLPDDE